MSTIDSVSASTTAAQTSATTASQQAKMDYDSFLQLLVAEMNSQDPLKPMDSTEFVAQLATFSNVEQNIQANKKLDDILQVSSLSQAGSFIGRTITAPDGVTTGVVRHVELQANGMTAVLESGTRVAIGAGVKVSE